MIDRARCWPWLLALGSAACAPAALDGDTALDEIYVGVMPYSASGYALDPISCPGADHMVFDLDNLEGCALATGAAGEQTWSPPTAVKYPIQREYCESDRRWSKTTLSFCRVRVKPDLFRPLAAAAGEGQQAYALLKFGDRCPDHSIEWNRWITNAYPGNENVMPDNAIPNHGSSELGNYTRLYFCMLMPGLNHQSSMTAFPDLGFPYVVFHDYDGPQPGWVMLKRWVLTDDAQVGVRSQYYPPIDTDPAGEVFSEIVESVQNVVVGDPPHDYPDTRFDLARVR
jgi:hypothetical protein